MKRQYLIIFCSILILKSLSMNLASASVEKAGKIYYGSKSNKRYLAVARELMNADLYFAAIPFIKEYLISRTRAKNSELDFLMDKIITRVGVKQFEIMPSKSMEQINSSMTKYILAKKFFRKGQYKRALKEVRRYISDRHIIKPFALMVEASSLAALKKNSAAINIFKDCVEVSNSWLGRLSDPKRIRQLEINRDYCIIGVARTRFAIGQYAKAELEYLDLEKSSYVWPEILFEEAWNSFYLNDYNRALGKLVTYKAPVLDFIFNPEVESLRAMSYLHLCLFDDAKEVVEDFYNRYSKNASVIRRYIKRAGRNYSLFANLTDRNFRTSVRRNSLFQKQINDIRKDPVVREMQEGLRVGKNEYKLLRRYPNTRFVRILSENIKNSLALQKNLIGAHVRKRMFLYDQQLEKTFRGMSYIKLEILSRKKDLIYSREPKKRTRGDVRYLKRNEKQYFWTFNGEFWADELGDYVFGLKSECKS